MFYSFYSFSCIRRLIFSLNIFICLKNSKHQYNDTFWWKYIRHNISCNTNYTSKTSSFMVMCLYLVMWLDRRGLISFSKLIIKNTASNKTANHTWCDSKSCVHNLHVYDIFIYRFTGSFSASRRVIDNTHYNHFMNNSSA